MLFDITHKLVRSKPTWMLSPGPGPSGRALFSLSVKDREREKEMFHHNYPKVSYKHLMISNRQVTQRS